MNIAVLGWGSLIWCPGSLRIKTKWHSNGPCLPIEFARISNDGRLTLVIHPSAPKVRTYWALSELDELQQARVNLANREGTSIGSIHFLTTDGNSGQGIPCLEELKAWLATQGTIYRSLRRGREASNREPRIRPANCSSHSQRNRRG
jgi:hypothetical protein